MSIVKEEGERMGKYQLDSKGKAAVTKFHEKNKPAQFNKQEQLKKLREQYLQNKKKADNE